MLRTRKHKKTNTTIPKQSPSKTHNQEHSQLQNKTNNYDRNNNSTTILRTPNEETNIKNLSNTMNNYLEQSKHNTNQKIHITDYFTDDSNTPITWFNTAINLAHLDNIFNEHQICSAIIGKLPTKIIKQISDEISELKESKEPLQILKTAICSKYTTNNRDTLSDCINDTNLGDRTPSELYKALKEKLNKIEKNKEFTKTFFLRALPDNIRMALITANTQSNEEMVKLADKLYAEYNYQVNSIQSQKKPQENNNTDILSNINNQLEKFNQQYQAIEKRLNNLETTQNNYTSFNKSSKNHKLKENDKQSQFCWYHEK